MKTKLCRPILVPTKEKSTFDGQLCLNGNHLFIARECDDVGDLQPQKLILISLDPEEKIEVGDKVLRPDGVIIIMSHSDMVAYLDSQSNATKKIIATQDQLPKEYIQQLVEQYNSHKVEDVEIEIIEDYGHIDKDYDPDDQENAIFIGEYLKLNDENQVQIVKRKPILYTEEEVKELLLKSVEETCTKHKVIQQIFKDNLSIWFEQNKKK